MLKRASARSVVVRVLLIEDDALLRRQLVDDLNAHPQLRVVGEADCWATARSLLEDATFDVALIDLNLNGRMSLDLIALGSQRARVVVYSVYGDMDAVLRAFADGASGYLHKGAASTDMAQTLVDVADGQVPISPTVAGHLINALHAPTDSEVELPGPERLTDRELEILELLARGLSIKEIASRCGITRNTVSFHTKQIYGKLRVSSRSEAVYQALSSGRIRVPDA